MRVRGRSDSDELGETDLRLIHKGERFWYSLITRNLDLPKFRTDFFCLGLSRSLIFCNCLQILTYFKALWFIKEVN